MVNMAFKNVKTYPLFRGQFKSCLLFVLVILIGYNQGFAAIEPYSNSMHGALKKGDTLLVKDEKFRSPVFKWSDIQNQRTQNIISLKIFQDTNAILPKSFTCELTLKVEYYANIEQSEPLKLENVRLRLKYKSDLPDSNKLLDTYNFQNGYWVKITIENVTSSEFGEKIPPFIELVSQIIIDRSYMHDRTKKIKPNYELINTFSNTGNNFSSTKTTSGKTRSESPVMQTVTSASISANEIGITWDGAGNDEYDIEWTTLDNENPDEVLHIQRINNNTITTDELNALFRHNATRVTTHGNQYAVTLTYYKSYLFFRIRTVQYTADGLRDEGDWDYTNGSGYALFAIPEWHEANLNYQFTAAYAEEGKKKEVISYFDGTLRSRQTVTVSDNRDESGVLNDDNKNLVIQENIYDEFGRVIATTLPAPKEGSSLKYYPNLNTTQSGQIYSSKNIISNSECETTPDPLGSTDGAGNYYSPANTFLLNSQKVVDNPFYKYIPDAEGYPFSVTLYTPDNTGRIKTMGGVGKAFQPAPANSHTTKYFYGKPEQDELDKLFGNDAGYAEHYLKNMVVDPNHQVSISYIDASGRTIATALSGETPENVEGLPAKPPVAQETHKIITPEQFQYDFANLTLSATSTYLSGIIDHSVSLAFDIDKLVYAYVKPGFTICSNCYYDLNIRIFDDCGALIFTKDDMKIGSEFSDCNNTGKQSATYSNIDFAKIGEYQIKFEFALSKKIIENYTNDYIAERQTRGDWKTESQFILEQAGLEEYEGCLSDCSTCKEELGTKSEFLTNAIAQFDAQAQGFDAAELNSYLDALYDRLYAHCQLIQSNCTISPCERYKKLMLADVSPDGQYARFQYSSDEILTTVVTPLEPDLNVISNHWRDAFPVLSPQTEDYKNNIIEKFDGTVTSVNDAGFSLTDFVIYWKPEWAEKFISYHPEYCKLEFCNQNTAYYNWDYKVQEEIKTAAGISTHAATLGAAYDYNNPSWLINKDPFFQTAGKGKKYAADMTADLQQFTTRILSANSAYNKNLIQFVDYSLYCIDPASATNTNTNTDYWTNCSPSAACRIPDREWEMYKEYYFQLKEAYYNLLQNGTTCFNKCAVGVPVSYNTTSCPTRTDIAILAAPSDMNYSCPAGFKAVIIKNTFGTTNSVLTVGLTHDVAFDNMGLPASVVFNAGETDKTLCIAETIPVTALYVSSVACSAASAVPSDICPYGPSGELRITGDYQHPEANIYITTSSTNSISYTIVSGRADQQPQITCTGTPVSLTYYSCYRVYLPGIGQAQQYYDVWVSACSIDPCANAPVINYQTTSSDANGPLFASNDPQNSCSYTSSVYHVFQGYGAAIPPSSPNYSCAAYGDFLGFYSCIKFQNSSTNAVSTYNDVWVYLCENNIDECGTGGGGGAPIQRQLLNTAKKDTLKTKQTEKSKEKVKKLKKWRILTNTKEIPNKFFKKSTAKKTTFTANLESAVINIQGVTIACSGTAFLHGSSNGETGFIQYNAPVDLSDVPPGATISLTCQAYDVPNRFTMYEDGQVFQVSTDWLGYSTQSGPWGQSISNSGSQTVSFVKGTASIFNLHVETAVSDMSNSDAWEVTIGVNCGTVSPPPICNPLLQYKKPRFTTIDKTVNPTDLDQQVNEGLIQIQQHLKSSCEGQAEFWVQSLDPCLKSRFSDDATYNAKKAELKQKLIEVCMAGGDLDHPDGASTVRPGQSSASGLHSFKEVILSVLGISTPDMLCNPWILTSPYPWEPKPQVARQTLSSTTPQVCTRLNALKQQYTAANSGLTFYNYLIQTFGSNNVTITEADIAALEKGCTNCRYLLEKEVPMPVFLEPGTTGCISASQYTAGVAALQSEFAAGALNVTDRNYEKVFSTYLNYRWGFTLSYDQYISYSNTIQTNPQTSLCNQPVFEPITLAPYQCINSLFHNAVANGTRAYIAYVEEQKKIFRTNYVNTCFTAKSTASLTIKQQTYHYTLYYYDQAGNLVKTVPPAGVNLLTGDQLTQVKEVRSNTYSSCSYTGPATNTDKNTALSKLSETLLSAGNSSIEMWLYSEGNAANQVLATTPDKKFMYHSCLNGNLLNIDIYSLVQNQANEIEFVRSNHTTVDLTSLQPLRPWVHIVVQGSQLATAGLQVFVNGSLRTGVTGEPSAGCTWEVEGGNPVQMPENLTTLKQIRFYNYALSPAQVLHNSQQPCLGLSTTAGDFTSQNQPILWGRFNSPPDGGGVVVDNTTGAETQYTPLFPGHQLVTTYTYNSMAQVVTQNTPDAGTSNFWYDRLGRLTVSQNDEQLAPATGGATNRYSYTTYDEQGRIIEVGEKENTSSVIPAPGFFYQNQDLQNFLNSGVNKQVTLTQYDVPATGSGAATGLIQENLRKRVAASMYKSLGTGPVEQASYYTYDLAGNVNTLWQQVSGLGIKQIDYQYDLVSGKVNAVGYQQNQPDAFYYQYKYDAENKLLKVLTNTTAFIQSNGAIRLEALPGTHIDAEYKYYLHGPLARVELGQHKVQGIDYAYTVQGWLKGINGSKLDAATDIGEDGKTGSMNYATNGRDVMAYTLGYYNNDYKAVGGTGANAFGVGFAQTATSFGAGLYNGNISHTTVALSKINNGALAGYTYKYDQLNRLTAMQFHNIGSSASWSNTLGTGNSFNESYSYDADGNIATLNRAGSSTQPAMDNLKYWYYYKNKDGLDKYYDASPGSLKPVDADKVTNKLAYVEDAVSAGNYAEDVDGQPLGNYKYDKIGNLIFDDKENITGISWTVYGKIAGITKRDGSTLQYKYDAAGNRVNKIYTNAGVTKTTYYLRDAQGNTLGLYEDAERIEQYLFGSSRLGVWKRAIGNNDPSREYELTNHLGNVLATISDTKTFNGSYSEANVLTTNDYYSFGMTMPGRSYTAGSSYRYGFNGKENDNEVKGKGSQQDYGMRIYDPRLGRFLSVDPLIDEYPELTPYQFTSNSPIDAIDLDGAERYYYKLALDEKTGVPQLTLLKTDKGWSFLGFSYTYDEKKMVEYNGQNYTFNTGWYDFAKKDFADFVADPEGTLESNSTIQSDEEELSNYAVEAGTAIIAGTVTTYRATGRNQKSQQNTPEQNTGNQATAANNGNANAASSNTASTKNTNTVNRLKTSNAKVYAKGNRTGTEKTIEIVKSNGNRKLINSKRVKEFVPSKKAAKGEAPVNYKKTGVPKGTKIIPGSKDKKRTLTDKEKKMINKVND